MSAAKPVRVLPADVYDTLELSALAWGGIGAGDWWDHTGAPVCAIGHALYALIPDGPTLLTMVGVAENANDDAIYRINRRRGAHGRARVSFEEWTRELNVVRGEATP